jgi:tRNA G18 (ribose-2'-O)-methylase SpoU
MPRVPIAALDDPRLDVYRHLKRRNETRAAGTCIAEGPLVVRRMLESGTAVRSVLASERRVESIAADVPEDVPLYVVPQEVGEELVGFNFHVGIMACGDRPEPVDLAAWLEPVDRPLAIAACPDVNDPENLGAILRLAACFGLDLVVLGPGCCDPYSRRVLRTSTGHALRLPIVASDDFDRDVQRLHDAGIETIATVLDPGAEPLRGFRPARRFAVLFGNEAHGLDPARVAACRRRATIPMAPRADSLNVAVAAGIVLYELGCDRLRA